MLLAIHPKYRKCYYLYISALTSRGYGILRRLAYRIHLACSDDVFGFEISRSPNAGILTTGKYSKDVLNKSIFIKKVMATTTFMTPRLFPRSTSTAH